MRPFRETLPTLRDPGAKGDPAAAPATFDPNVILKALGASSSAEGASARSPAPASGMRAFSADQLPRRSETRFVSRAAETELKATIPSFDRVPAGDPAPATPDKTADEAQARESSEREKAIEAAREEEREKARNALVEARIRWAEESSDKISRELDQAFVDLHNRLADALTLALTPILEEAMRVKAVDRFSGALERLTGRDSCVQPITIRGPQVLLDALKAARSGDTAGLKLVASDESELVASVNDTTLRTTIKAWASTLAAATGSRHG